MKETYVSGIIGLSMGAFHLDAVIENGAKIGAICDVNEETLKKIGDKYNIPEERRFTDWKELMKIDELDIIHIVTPDQLHREMAEASLAAGKHVLTEKPISNDIEEAREMVRFACQQDLYLGCNLNHYFSEPAFMADKLIADGQIGEQVYALTKVGFNGSTVDVPDIDPTSRWQYPYSHAKAFLTHPFSVMRHFSGDVKYIQAFMDKPGARRQGGDMMLSIQSIHMQFQNGCVGYLLSQRGDAHFGLGGWWSYELAGTKGTFCIENCVEKLTVWQKDKEPVITNTGVTDFGATFPIRIHAFLEDVTNKVDKEHLRASGRDALATMEYIFAAIDSYESGGELVRPHALPAFHGSVNIIK